MLRGRHARVATATAAALAAALVAAGLALAGHEHNPGHGHNAVAKVLVLDDCEPVSFNHVLGPDACVGHGTTTFGQFIEQLETLKNAPAWRFDPSELGLATGGRIRAANLGGEFHTFTEVVAFGGGCVDELNAILGLTPVPECANPSVFETTGLGPGEKLKTGPLAAGTHRFLCLIHPWMRTTATVG